MLEWALATFVTIRLRMNWRRNWLSILAEVRSAVYPVYDVVYDIL